MPIIRDKHEGNYCIVSNTVANDLSLSYKARGLLLYLLSKPDDWKVVHSDLVKHGTDGPSAVRSGIDELLARGYLSRNQPRKQDGTYGEAEYIVYETPYSDYPHTEKPHADNPNTDNRTLLNTNVTNNPYTKKKVSKEAVKPAVVDFQTIINEFTDNEALKAAVWDFIKMRTMMKKAPTNRALGLVVKKLASMSTDPNIQIAALEQSTVNNWTDVYPIKDIQPQRGPTQPQKSMYPDLPEIINPDLNNAGKERTEQNKSTYPKMSKIINPDLVGVEKPLQVFWGGKPRGVPKKRT